MNNPEKQIIIDRYAKRLAQFGYDPKTLGWTKGKHNLRFHILLSQWNLDNADILDFGCGFGDMYAYCMRHFSNTRYQGIDLNQELITEGKKQYPNADLSARDAFAASLDKQYDYIFSSGVHNFKLTDNWRFIQDTFELFNNFSTKGFALNFLSNKVEYELSDTYHSDPALVLDLCYKYSNRVVLRNDYMPFEFTVFVDKQNEFDKDHGVYPEFLRCVEKE
jgi:SAM-dependent methyltransferase